MSAFAWTPGTPAWTGGLLVAALALALWIDRRWGEPPKALHPVVWMGHYLRRLGQLASSRRPAPAFALGALAWCLGAALVAAATWWLQAAAIAVIVASATPPSFGAGSPTGWLATGGALLLAVLVLGVTLKPLFAWRMLHEESAAVEAALRLSLPAGRERLSWLVSRDTACLSPQEVRQSAIESLAENLNDSVVAPLFWFTLFGLPGAAVYRFANTADAMWGYRGHYRGRHWEWAGKWAARADDLLSWLPARLTAALLRAAARGECRVRPRWRAVAAEARKTPSPNSGWPMAAAALALDLRLGKPGVYLLHPDGREPQAPDMDRMQRLAAGAVRRGAWLASAALALSPLISMPS